jgi:hypothetical protein
VEAERAETAAPRITPGGMNLGDEGEHAEIGVQGPELGLERLSRCSSAAYAPAGPGSPPRPQRVGLAPSQAGHSTAAISWLRSEETS